MVWPIHTLNKISLEVRRDIVPSSDNAIELFRSRQLYSWRLPLTTEKKTESKVNTLTIWTV